MAGKPSSGDHEGTRDETEEPKVARGEYYSKATPEIGVSGSVLNTKKVLTSLTHLGVDPTKILIGKENFVVIFEVVPATREVTKEHHTIIGCKAGPKFVGGTNIAYDVPAHHITAKEAPGEERSINEPPCPGISCSVNSSSLETAG